jgi:hypothetical protein
VRGLAHHYACGLQGEFEPPNALALPFQEEIKGRKYELTVDSRRCDIIHIHHEGGGITDTE